MGGLLGIPEWLAVALFVAAGLVTYFAFASWRFRIARRRLAEKRPCPSREEFMILMSRDVDQSVAAWMWNCLVVYYDPLTPHPDDHLLDDASIDDGDVTMDWLPSFAKAEGLNWKEWPEWPVEWSLTVRNFARYLQLGHDRLQR